MARLIADKVFNPKQPLLVRRAFSAAGRTFQQGDSFDWTRLAISTRRVSLMFEAGQLYHADDAKKVVTETVVTETVVTETVVTETEQTPPPADNSDLDVDSLVVLQAIAQREGATLKSTKAAQRQAIIDKRQG
jgi:hypothetical protein